MAYEETMKSPLNLTRRRLVQGVAALTVQSALEGCGGKRGPETSASADAGGADSGVHSDGSAADSASPPSPADAGANPQPVPSGPLTKATVTVTGTTVGTFGPDFVGLSYGKNVLTLSPHLLSGGNTALIALLTLLASKSTAANPPVLRVGGSQVDQSVWTPAGKGGVSGEVAPADVDALAAFIAACGFQCLYAVNLGGAAPGWAYPTTPSLAAEEVAYVYGAFAKAGAKLLGIEIGNECDQYAHKGNPFDGQTWTLSTFETLWSTYRSAILATTPSAVITGPASGNNETTWTVPFGTWATSSNIALLTQHYYRANSSGATTAQLLSYPDTALVGDLAALAACSSSINVPFRMSETNSFNAAGTDGTVGVSSGYGSALWVIDHMFTCALGGASGVNMSGDSDQATGYQPISDSGGAVVAVNPEYYGILLVSLVGSGTLLDTSVSAGALNVSAYTVESASGGASVVVVNKDNAENLEVTLTLPASIHSASLLTLSQLSAGSSAPNLAATSGVTIQGATVGTDGTFSPGAPYALGPVGQSVTFYVPAATAVLLELS